MKTKFILLIVAVFALLVLLRFIKNGSTDGFADLADNAGTFTLYFADWCAHCKNVKPSFDEWSKNGFVTVNGKNVKVQAIEPEKNPEAVKGVSIKGYPTLVYSSADGKTVEFSGERSPENYMKFLEEQLQGLNVAQQ